MLPSMLSLVLCLLDGWLHDVLISNHEQDSESEIIWTLRWVQRVVDFDEHARHEPRQTDQHHAVFVHAELPYQALDLLVVLDLRQIIFIQVERVKMCVLFVDEWTLGSE